jgi:hypothetical protein
MKMHANLSFEYPDDEDKLRRAINAEVMYETLRWIDTEIKDNADMKSILEKISTTFKLIGES